MGGPRGRGHRRVRRLRHRLQLRDLLAAAQVAVPHLADTARHCQHGQHGREHPAVLLLLRLDLRSLRPERLPEAGRGLPGAGLRHDLHDMLRGMLGEFSPGAAVLVLALCTILTNLGSCLVGIGGVASTIKSFPVSQRGVVTGLVKTGNGISAGIYTQIYLGFIAPDIFGFLFMCFIVSSCTVFVASHFLGVDTTALRHVRDTRGKKTDRQHVASCYSTRCTMLSFCFQDKLRTARVVVRTSVLFSLFWIACWQEEKVRKTPLLSHFYTTNDHFTKTGSRQTL